MGTLGMLVWERERERNRERGESMKDRDRMIKRENVGEC